jgi:hypothetical protein
MRNGRTRVGIALVVSLTLVAGAAHAVGGSFKGTFGDVRFKARKRLVGCNYSRAVQLILVTGAQVVQHGRHQRGASASGNAPDPSAPGTTFPIAVTNATASFLDGADVWAGVLDAQSGTMTLTGYARGKLSGTLTTTLLPSPPTTGPPITVDAKFKVKCAIQ